YDFVVAPGADPRQIRLRFDGAESLRLDDEGNLVISVEGGELVQAAPRVYQEADSGRERVSGAWALRNETEAGFAVSPYDTTRALVLDPVLSYSTYLGGFDNDWAYAIAVDGSGSAYVAGHTLSTDFPTEHPYQTDQPDQDVFVTKLSPTGNSLVY